MDKKVDLDGWEIKNLSRRGNDLKVWYFQIVKPDGRTLTVPSGYYDHDLSKPVWEGFWSSVYPAETGGTTWLRVYGKNEVAAIRKAMRYVTHLANRWQAQETIAKEEPKAVKFKGTTPVIVDSSRLLESAEPKEDEPVKAEKRPIIDLNRRKKNV